jgi:hypothetical protein
MKLSEEDKEKLIDFGALGYDNERISILLDIPEQKIIEEFNNSESDISKSYKKGIYISEYKIDMKLFEMATKGDIKALEKYEKRKDKFNKKSPIA